MLAVEIEAPRPAGGWDGLRAAIGAPDAKLAYWDGVVESKDGQWVYPARGLAVFITLADTEIARVVGASNMYAAYFLGEIELIGGSP